MVSCATKATSCPAGRIIHTLYNPPACNSPKLSAGALPPAQAAVTVAATGLIARACPESGAIPPNT